MSEPADGQYNHGDEHEHDHAHGEEPHKHDGDSCEHGDHCEGHCDHDHDHDDHDHEHPHKHAEGEHDHNEEGHDHEDHEHHDHEHHDHNHEHAPAVKEKFSLRGAFHKVVDYIKNNKAESAIIGTTASILLASTALSPPLLPVTLALGLGAASIFAMHKTGDATLAHMMAFGKKLNLSQMKLGLLLGAMTTVPELAASVVALLQGERQIAFGNVLGGNVAHTLLILGATAAFAGITAGKKGLSWAFNTKVMAGATGLFAGAIALGSMLSDKVDQYLFPTVGVGMLYMGYRYLKERLVAREQDNAAAIAAGKECSTGACPFHDHGHGDEHDHDHEHHDHDHDHAHEHGDDPLDDGHNHGHSNDGKAGPSPDSMPAWFNGAWVAAGMAGLSGAAALLLHSAQSVGVDLGLTKEFVGAVTVGLGISVPELIMSYKAAKDSKSELALGSVIGCNIFTTLLVGGAVALGGYWHPEMMKIATPSAALNTAAFAGSAALATGALMANKGSLKKWHGWAGMALYGAYALGALALGHHGPTVKPPQATQAPVIQQHQQLPAPLKAPATPKVVLNDMPKFVEPAPAAESQTIPDSYESSAQETKEAPATFAPAAQQQHLKPAPFALF